MAGRPKLRKLEADILELGGEEWVLGEIASGRRIGDIAEQFGVSRRLLYQWRDRAHRKDRIRPLWEEAVAMSAEADVETAMAHFDRLDEIVGHDPVSGQELRRVPASSEVQLASSRAKYLQWLASRKDPDRYGAQDAAVAVNVNLGSLHLDALAAVKSREALPAAPVEEADFELLPPEGGE